jgi:hypothetical protein
MVLLLGHNNGARISEFLPATLTPVLSFPFLPSPFSLTRHLIATSPGIPTPQRRNRYLFGRKLGPRE